ncbi:MAG TPA: hypothetical protein HPP56_07790 [Nitrospirae bacterium]|nr:hypothetical protein [Nitrospirota bacterium]
MSYKNSTPALTILLADFTKLFSSIADFEERLRCTESSVILPNIKYCAYCLKKAWD